MELVNLEVVWGREVWRCLATWDSSLATMAGWLPGNPRFPDGPRLELDEEEEVVAGDMAEEAYRKTKARRPPGPGPVLVSRREHVSMRDGAAGRGHRTCVVVRGKERQISVDLVSRGQQGQGQGQAKEQRDRDRAEVGMSVSVDGERVLHIRRLRWKFHGSEKVDLGGGRADWPRRAWQQQRLAAADPCPVLPPPRLAAAAEAAAAVPGSSSNSAPGSNSNVQHRDAMAGG